MDFFSKMGEIKRRAKEVLLQTISGEDVVTSFEKEFEQQHILYRATIRQIEELRSHITGYQQCIRGAADDTLYFGRLKINLHHLLDDQTQARSFPRLQARSYTFTMPKHLNELFSTNATRPPMSCSLWAPNWCNSMDVLV